MAITQDLAKATSENRVLNESFDQDYRTLVFQPLGFDGQGISRTTSTTISIQLEFNSVSNPIYIGLAAPGTATNAAKWQIRKLTYDVNDNPTKIQYANGSGNFDQVWDNRASLTYS